MSTTEEVCALINSRTRALAENNVEHLRDLLHPSYHHIDIYGKLYDLEEFLKAFCYPGAIQSYSKEPSIVSIEVSETDIITVYDTEGSFVHGGHPYAGVVRNSHTIIRHGENMLFLAGQHYRYERGSAELNR